MSPETLANDPVSKKALAFMRDYTFAADCGVSPEHLAAASSDVKAEVFKINPFRKLTKVAIAALSTDEIIDRVVIGYKVMMSAYKRKMSAQMQARFVTRAALGYHARPVGMKDLEWAAIRVQIATRADSIIDFIIKGGDPAKLTGPDRVVACRVYELIRMNLHTWATADTVIATKLKVFSALVPRLPVWDHVKGIAGLRERELCRLVGEVGDLWKYPTVGHLWSRLGLGVMRNGTRQRNKTSLEMPYSPRRRNQMRVISNSVLFRDSERDDKTTGEVLKESGPWRAVYDRKKTEYMERVDATAGLAETDPAKWSRRRAHDAAMRYLVKQVVKYIYNAWRASMPRPKEHSHGAVDRP